jgi:hypothetical protein
VANLIQVVQPWVATKMHGHLALALGGDVETTVTKNLFDSIKPEQMPTYNTIKYCIVHNMDGTQSIFFELLNVQ